MCKINYKISHRRGFSTFIILLILAVLSSSIVGVSVNKTYRQLLSVFVQQDTFSAETYAAALLNNIIFEHFAFGKYQHTPISNLGWDFISAETISPISIKNKQFQEIELTVTANHSSTATFTYQVSLLRSRRLENIPNSALEYWPPTETHLMTQQYFSTNKVDFLNYQVSAQYNADSCENLTEQHFGLLWIKGNCELTSFHLGKIERPVILVVEDGSITINHANVNGLIVHLCDVANNHLFSLDTNSNVIGGIVSSCSTPTNLLSLQFHPDILNTTLSHQDNVLTSVTEGSWLKQ